MSKSEFLGKRLEWHVKRQDEIEAKKYIDPWGKMCKIMVNAEPNPELFNVEWEKACK